MEIPYRHIEKIKINQHLKDPSRRQVDTLRTLLVLLPDKSHKDDWNRLVAADVLKSRYRRMRHHDHDSTQLQTDLPNNNGTRVILQLVTPASSTFELLTLGRKLAAAVRPHDPAIMAIQIAGFADPDAARLVNALTAAILASVCPMPCYKSRTESPSALKRIDIYGLTGTIDLAQVRAETMGNHLARWLSALPPNELTPASYRKRIADLAEREGWRMTFLNSGTLARNGAGAFLAVAQGSPEKDAGIVHLRYRPGRRGGKSLALVGKGICFDTGGVNVKPAKYMNGMHEDMQGSAVALGTLLALSELGTDHPVDCWLALAQNHVGSRAYKPNDVVSACNGTSIEVIHTDAEGRMVLADTLALASRGKPHTLIDYATLTGACIYSLSSRYSGVFSNRDTLHEALTAAGRDSGERVWPFPLDADFEESLKSEIADTKQCTLEGEADHILAAQFLRRFVNDDINWIHVDLAASHHKGGLGHISTDTTGFGVRYTLNLLRQHALMETAWN
jgi:leucyl aminopeptidase